jgi:hypothetical protein
MKETTKKHIKKVSPQKPAASVKANPRDGGGCNPLGN